ncbi:hypothetical protein L1987_46497 [Smallanthus sonchifolius]|uniref:Uncharacterized protein n=1 Tax=Smallanthus sonchifolius TaxID=185202 RepID=A0ACB9FZB3_9ASTR|nr:hypothetical protein L1987_46497 [Smallanthus sonchifolius]
MIQMLPVNSKVYYFPQGHAEHAADNVKFRDGNDQARIPCRVAGVMFMADADIDKVYAKVKLIPGSLVLLKMKIRVLRTEDCRTAR